MDSVKLPKRAATVATQATTHPTRARASTTGTTATTTTTTNELSGSGSDDEVIPESDHSEHVIKATSILLERLQAWKHMCGYLENYVTAMQKIQKAESKEFDRVFKTVSEPLKEGHHFMQGDGGVVQLFTTLRNTTRGVANIHLETEKNLKTNVLPIIERLKGDIKAKSKELKSGSTNASKSLAKARGNTQRHIEMLGQYAASFDSSARNKIDCANDPYLLCRGVYHRLNKQVTEENSTLREILAIQNTFQQFEGHIIETVQNAFNQFVQCMSAQSDRQRALYAEIAGTTQQIPPDYEWANFYERNDAALINPNTPPRALSTIQFPNQDHRATKPLVSGMLERKSRAVVKGYNSGFYVITPAGYMHGFKEDNTNDYEQEPTPDISLYLPECTVGGFEGLKFSIKGKDVSGGKVGNAFHMSYDLNFKAPTMDDAETWSNALSATALARSGTGSGGSQPTSPAGSRNVSGAHDDGDGGDDRSPASASPHDRQEETVQTSRSGSKKLTRNKSTSKK